MAKKKSSKFKVKKMEDAPELFLVGMVIGGGAAYVLSDQTLRARVFRYAMQTYGNVTQSVAEVREQLADIQAEIATEQAVQA